MLDRKATLSAILSIIRTPRFCLRMLKENYEKAYLHHSLTSRRSRLTVSDANFTVRTIYFQPTDAIDKTADIRKMMADVHDYFGREMQRLTLTYKTFRIEKDASDQIVVHTVRGKHPAAHYSAFDTTYTAVAPELPAHLKVRNNIHIIFVGGMHRIQSQGVSALGVGTLMFGNHQTGHAVIPANNLIFHVAVHEVAHTFGLQHNLSTEIDYVMGLDAGHAGFAEYEARWLDKNHYFNDKHPVINFVPRIVKLHPVRVIDIPNHIIQVKVDVESPNGIHQAEIARPQDGGVLDKHVLNANAKETAVFEFNVHKLGGETQPWVRVMDTHGNIWMQPTYLEIPPAAFFDSEPEPTTPLKPNGEPIKPTYEPIKPTGEPMKPIDTPKKTSDEPIKPTDKKATIQNDPENHIPKHVIPDRKFMILWARIKRV